MNIKKLTFLAALVAAVVVSGISTANAAPVSNKAAVKSVVQAPAAEIPAKAAQVVRQTPTTDRASVTVAVVKAIAKKNAKALVPSVAAIAKACPDMAATAAGAAAAAAPSQAEAIAVAATKAAPSNANDVITAVGSAAPEYAKASTRKVTTTSSASSASAQGTIASAPGTIGGGTRTDPTEAPNAYAAPAPGRQ